MNHLLLFVAGLVGLVVGLGALIVTLVVDRQLIRQEVRIMFGVTLLMGLLVLDGNSQPWEGGLLLVLLVFYTSFLVMQSRLESAAAKAQAAEVDEFEADLQAPFPGAWDAKQPAQLALMAAALVLLVLGSDWLVSAAVVFAKALGVSDVVIALTIVAAGTFMPEVATSITAALMVAPSLLAHVRHCRRNCPMGKGHFFAGYYVAYVAYLILAAQEHSALGTFSTAMLSFVVPLTLITLVVSVERRRA